MPPGTLCANQPAKGATGAAGSPAERGGRGRASAGPSLGPGSVAAVSWQSLCEGWAPVGAVPGPCALAPTTSGGRALPRAAGVGFPEPRTESGSVAWAVRAQLRGLERASVKPSAWGGRCGPEGAGSCPSLAVTSRGGEQAPPPNLPCLAKQAQGMWVLVGSGRPPVLAPPRTHF